MDEPINCPHMSGDAVCSLCKELDRVKRELEEVKARLAAIKRGDAVQGRLTLFDEPKGK